MTTPLHADQLSGARVLVTGSSRGIGAKTAQYLSQSGASVVINYRNKAQRAEKLVSEIEAAGGKALAIGADLTNPLEVARLVIQIKETWGGLDILILNASGGNGSRHGRGLRDETQSRRPGRYAHERFAADGTRIPSGVCH